jgi:integrase
LRDGLSPATVQRIRATLRRALNQAVRLGLVASNVAAIAPAPRATRPIVPAMSPAQAVALERAFRGHRLHTAVVVALSTGIRQGELRALVWEDVDLDYGLLTVRRSAQRIDGRHELVEPKTRAGRRRIHLPPFTQRTLRVYRARRGLPAPHAFVFPNRSGGILDAATLTHQFQRRLEEVGLPRMRWHDLRHGCASLLIALGTHPRYVQEQLGHSGIAVTMDTYAHVLPAGLKASAERLGELLEGK